VVSAHPGQTVIIKIITAKIKRNNAARKFVHAVKFPSHLFFYSIYMNGFYLSRFFLLPVVKNRLTPETPIRYGIKDVRKNKMNFFVAANCRFFYGRFFFCIRSVQPVA
jgi:hypothetical protein